MKQSEVTLFKNIFSRTTIWPDFSLTHLWNTWPPIEDTVYCTYHELSIIYLQWRTSIPLTGWNPTIASLLHTINCIWHANNIAKQGCSRLLHHSSSGLQNSLNLMCAVYVHPSGDHLPPYNQPMLDFVYIHKHTKFVLDVIIIIEISGGLFNRSLGIHVYWK